MALGDLRYARKDPGGAWVTQIVDVTGEVGWFTSIAVDGTGAVHVAYYDYTNSAIKRASTAP